MRFAPKEDASETYLPASLRRNSRRCSVRHRRREARGREEVVSVVAIVLTFPLPWKKKR